MSERRKEFTIEISGDLDTKETIASAFYNLGIPISIIGEIAQEKPLVIDILGGRMSALSLLMNISNDFADRIEGTVTFPSGETYRLDREGLKDLKQTFYKTLLQPRRERPAMWWLYFIPELREVFKEIIGLIRWYPRAMGEGRRVTTRNFLYLILAIVIGVGILTYFGKVSGDAFIFAIASLLGYVFAFLQRFLGLVGEE